MVKEKEHKTEVKMTVSSKVGNIKRLLERGLNVSIDEDEDKGKIIFELIGVAEELDKGLLSGTTLRDSIVKEEEEKYHKTRESLEESVNDKIFEVIKNLNNVVVILDEKDRNLLKRLYENGTQFIIFEEYYGIKSIYG